MEFHFNQKTELSLTNSSKIFGYVQGNKEMADQYLLCVDGRCYPFAMGLDMSDVESYSEKRSDGSTNKVVLLIKIMLHKWYYNISNSRLNNMIFCTKFRSLDEQEMIISLMFDFIRADYEDKARRLARPLEIEVRLHDDIKKKIEGGEFL